MYLLPMLLCSYVGATWILPSNVAYAFNQSNRSSDGSMEARTGSSSLFERQMISFRLVQINDSEAPIGYITSTNYPKPYPVNSSSVVKLVAHPSSRYDTIKITFLNLDLQTSNGCEGEALEILISDGVLIGGGARARRIYAICGNIIPKPIILPSKIVLLHFTSDAFNSGKSLGFKMKFEFLNSATQLHHGCEEIDHFKCRNRNCIPNSLKCNHHDDCGDASDEDMLTPCTSLPTIAYSIDYKCGISPTVDLLSKDQKKIEHPILTDRISGGNRVTHQVGWPFQVSIQVMRVEPVSHLCGATLIHPLFVLSAAHCFKGSIATSEYKFILGTQDLKNTSQPIDASGTVNSRIQVRYASSISLYPGGIDLRDLEEVGLRQIDLSNDLALIELNAPVRLTSYVWPACLPHLMEPLLAGRECLASGFGDTHGTGHTSLLKHVEQVIQHSSNCQSVYSDFKVDDYSMICVKNKLSNGPCDGDSGGPLFCSDSLNGDSFSSTHNDSLPPRDTDVDSDSVHKDESGNIDKLKPGDFIKYLPVVKNEDKKRKPLPNKREDFYLRYTVHGVTSFTTDGNLEGGFCGLEKVPTIYARVSTKVEWILSKMKLAMRRLSREDNQQSLNNRSSLFGYLFRSGQSRHSKLTRAMTVYEWSSV